MRHWLIRDNGDDPQAQWWTDNERTKELAEREGSEVVEYVPAADQLAEAVEALRKLAEIHHGTITPSRLHDPENRDWTECECKSCRLAQPFGGTPR